MRSNYKLKDYNLCYPPKWIITGFDNYYFTFDKKLFNTKTNRFSKKVVRGYSVGFNLNGKFITLEKLKSLVKIVEKPLFDLSDPLIINKLSKEIEKNILCF